MKEVYTSVNLVDISHIRLRLEQAGLRVFCLDQHTSLMEGSLGILPTRIMVTDEDYHVAVQIIEAIANDQAD